MQLGVSKKTKQLELSTIQAFRWLDERLGDYQYGGTYHPSVVRLMLEEGYALGRIDIIHPARRELVIKRWLQMCRIEHGEDPRALVEMVVRESFGAMASDFFDFATCSATELTGMLRDFVYRATAKRLESMDLSPRLVSASLEDLTPT